MYRTIDLLVEGPNGSPALVVECKPAPAVPDSERNLEELARAVGSGGSPFAMLVDSAEIRVYRSDAGRLQKVLSLPTADVLKTYEPRFGSVQVYNHYFTTLVAAWLRDVMFHWRGPAPPGERELQRIGLTDVIAGGETRREVRLRAAPVP